MAIYPQLRLRRLRRTGPLRSLIKETKLSVDDLIYPIFVTHGRALKEAIEPMPGCYQLSLDHLLGEVKEVADLGIPGVLLFGLPAHKDSLGAEAYDDHGIIQEAIRVIKQAMPDLLVATDVCLCQYTDHGQCGVIKDNYVDNDETLQLYGKVALSHAKAGSDVVAPSGMMDGQVKTIRDILDGNGYQHIPILSYAAKYASSFYGPFRVAAVSAPQYGDRLSYQIDPSDSRMALREIEADITEGADIIMIKPALPYLDIIARARTRFDHPIAAYNVSGEYSLVKAAARNDWIDEKNIVLELLTGIKRAGADIIISYHAKDAARWLLDQH